MDALSPSDLPTSGTFDFGTSRIVFTSFVFHWTEKIKLGIYCTIRVAENFLVVLFATTIWLENVECTSTPFRWKVFCKGLANNRQQANLVFLKVIRYFNQKLGILIQKPFN